MFDFELRGESITAPQLLTARPNFDGEIYRQSCWTYDEIRELRMQPTVALTRSMVMAPMLASSWSVDASEINPELNIPEEMVTAISEYITDYILPLKTHMQTAVSGVIDYGFQCFEKVIELDERHLLFYVKELKPLLPDYTTLLVDATGGLRGVRNDVYTRRVDLDIERALVYYIDVEGTNWYGNSLLANDLRPYTDWKSAADDLRYYNGKVAGTRFILYYPPGESKDEHGNMVDNRKLAEDFANRLMQNKAVLFPNETISELTFTKNEDPKGSWQLEKIDETGTTATDFIPAMEYWDNLMVRGLGVPERSVLEAQHGSRADAEAHTASMDTLLQIRLDNMMQLFNKHCVDQMIRINFGEDYEGLVSVKASPITDQAIDYVRQFYSQYVLSTDHGKSNELPYIDFKSLSEKLQLPRLPQPINAPYQTDAAMPQVNGNTVNGNAVNGNTVNGNEVSDNTVTEQTITDQQSVINNNLLNESVGA